MLAAAAISAQNSRAVSTASYLERGNQWPAKGEWDRAIADYNLAIAFDSRAVVTLYNRGVARQRKGDLSGAGGQMPRPTSRAAASWAGR